MLEIVVLLFFVVYTLSHMISNDILCVIPSLEFILTNSNRLLMLELPGYDGRMPILSEYGIGLRSTVYPFHTTSHYPYPLSSDLSAQTLANAW